VKDPGKAEKRTGRGGQVGALVEKVKIFTEGRGVRQRLEEKKMGKKRRPQRMAKAKKAEGKERLAAVVDRRQR